MSKYFQFILVIVYAILLIGSFFVVIDLFGWLHKPLRDSVVFGSILVWLLFSFSAAWFLSGFFLLFQNVRRPILEEEQKILYCFGDVLQRASDGRRYRLLIQEEAGMNAFATGYRTIVVTSGLLNGLTDSEIKAVMAHELGHLTSRDSVAGMAFSLTGYIPRRASLFLFLIKWLFFKIARMADALGGILGLGVVIFLFYYFHLLKYAGAILLYMGLLYFFDRLFRFLWRSNSRYTEYRQDAFAQKLGLGQDLRKAFIKMIAGSPQKVGFFYIFQSDHPFTHNRIRRLEKMEGLRE